VISPAGHGVRPEQVGLLIVGLGPGGTALLSAARAAGALDGWLEHGLLVVDPGGDGSGRLGQYAVRSDTTGRVFAEVSRDALPASDAALLARCDADEPVPLSVAAALLAAAARPTLSAIAPARVVGVVTGLRPGRNGIEVTVATDTGPRSLLARRVVIASGGRALIPAAIVGLGVDVVHSDAVIRGQVVGEGHVVIVGGSHSAFSAARVLLAQPQVGSVTIHHRAPVRVTYADRSAAAADGCRFGPQDVCPATGRVFRFGGLRTDSAELYRAIRDGAETRVRLTGRPIDAERARSADLVVAATGYGPRVGSLLPPGAGPATFDHHGALHVAGRMVAGVFGLGLGAGHRRDLATGGEPSFCGAIDGVWFYRNVVAPALLERLSAG
jgi:hypothetical protein